MKKLIKSIACLTLVVMTSACDMWSAAQTSVLGPDDMCARPKTGTCQGPSDT